MLQQLLRIVNIGCYTVSVAVSLREQTAASFYQRLSGICRRLLLFTLRLYIAVEWLTLVLSARNVVGLSFSWQTSFSVLGRGSSQILQARVRVSLKNASLSLINFFILQTVIISLDITESYKCKESLTQHKMCK